MWCGQEGKPSEGGGGTPPYVLGCAYVEDSLAPYTCLNLIQYNTSNTSRNHNSVTSDVETRSKLIKH
jgi:hypothetical protein